MEPRTVILARITMKYCIIIPDGAADELEGAWWQDVDRGGEHAEQGRDRDRTSLSRASPKVPTDYASDRAIRRSSLIVNQEQ